MASEKSSKDSSDPVSYKCSCSCSSTGETGHILLFYRYYSQPPTHSPLLTGNQTPQDLADFHKSLTTKLFLGGKIRIATEGFNITVGGTSSSIRSYISELLAHWSFTNLDLATEQKQIAYFKPSPGCGCAFANEAKINVKEEVTPLGVTNYTPSNWECVKSLEPWEWHERFSSEDRAKGSGRVLIDVRNHYESRIGYFVDPSSGKDAIKPAIRRFSQWPGFASKFFNDFSIPEPTIQASEVETGRSDLSRSEPRKEIYTYCTGGIRCEKGVRWLAENTPSNLFSANTIYTLHGGISSYLLWLDAEIAAGRKSSSDSLFKGRNYVFDGRGSVGLADGEEEAVSKCHGCGEQESRLGKCKSEKCHLVLVVCESCEVDGVLCCPSCEEERGICECEREREKQLWGGEKPVRIRRGRKKDKNGGFNVMRSKEGLLGTEVAASEIDVRIKPIN